MSFSNTNISEQLPEPAISKHQFQFLEDKTISKFVYVVYGNKGDGKTTASIIIFPGTISVLSFDRKTTVIKENYFDNDTRVRVYDAIKYLDEDPGNYVKSADITYDYILFLIDNISKSKPDYIMIDGLEILSKIAEMKMRSMNGLGYKQGTSNPNVWKDRQLLLRKIHSICFNACKKGVIYTTYTDKDEIVEEGSMIVKRDIPKWADVVLWQTDVVIRVRNQVSKAGREFIATVESSKIKDLETGLTLNITKLK